MRGANEYKAGIYDGTNGYTTPWYTNDVDDFNDNVTGVNIGGFQVSTDGILSWDDKIKNIRVIKDNNTNLSDTVLETITTDYSKSVDSFIKEVFTFTTDEAIDASRAQEITSNTNDEDDFYDLLKR